MAVLPGVKPPSVKPRLSSLSMSAVLKPDHRLLRALDLGRDLAPRGDGGDLVQFAEELARCPGRAGRVGHADDVVAAYEVGCGQLLDGLVRAGADHVQAGDQGQADGQRGGGGGGAARVAYGVLPGQLRRSRRTGAVPGAAAAITGRDSSGVSTNTPVSNSTAPRPSQSSPVGHGGGGDHQRRLRRRTGRRRWCCVPPANGWRAGACTLLIAATGGIFAARRAGSQAANR